MVAEPPGEGTPKVSDVNGDGTGGPTGRDAAGSPGQHHGDGPGAVAGPDGAAGAGHVRGFGFVLLFTVLGTVIPGLGLIVAGWRKLGALVPVLSVAAVVVLAVRVGINPIGTLGSALTGNTPRRSRPRRARRLRRWRRGGRRRSRRRTRAGRGAARPGGWCR